MFRKKLEGPLPIIVIGIVILIGSLWTLSIIYKGEIEEQFGLRQMAQLEREITTLDTDITEKTADIVRMEDELASAKSVKQKLEAEKASKQAQHDKIKTAIYYLNKALGTDQQPQ